MPRLHKGHKYILCIIDKVTNYLITVPIFQARSEEIGEALIENITKYCIPEYMIMAQDSTFMSSLMAYLLHKFDIKIKLAKPPGSQYAGTAVGRHEIHILSLMQNSSHSEEGKGWVG